MKRLLLIVAMALTLTFSADADEPRQHLALMPGFSKCFDLLRFESLHTDPQDDSVRINLRNKNQMDLVLHYYAVVGWLRGYFTALNLVRSFNGLTPDATKSTEQKEWMPWIYSYCRSHPTDNLEDVATELVKSFSASSNKDSK